ncbi:hypothetical protein [Sphingobium agri]|uniref:hypothetical protein n=1 Tax=Sphingobium agri TaxID=2933566 RepID=UPI001FF2E6A4|nr:hypothetical protein [Sphingobium agri]
MARRSPFPPKASAALTETINDFSGDVVTRFRCLAKHYFGLVDMLRFRVASRTESERLIRKAVSASKRRVDLSVETTKLHE